MTFDPETNTAVEQATAEAGTITLDVRSLHPRDRHQTIFDGLDELDTGDTLHLINDHDPAPLRYQLEAEFPDHYLWESVEAGPEQWVVEITCRARIVDARPVIAGGGEPFGAIMDAASSTVAGEVLVVYAPFDPVPLEEVLTKQGFEHVAEQIDSESWRVRFVRQ